MISNQEINLKETPQFKIMSSPEANYIFSKVDGTMITWGKTKEQDAELYPAPTILDIEVTTKCEGVGGVLCPFCFPAGTQITMSDSTTKNIEDINPGDLVYSRDLSCDLPSTNEVKEIYKRNYTGAMVTVELEDGRIIKTTPNHPFYARGLGWLEAGNLTEEMDIIDICEKVNN